MDKVAQKVESYLLASYGLTKMDADDVNVANLADSLSSEDEDGTPLRLPNPQKLFEQLIMDGNSSMPNEVFINLIAAGVNYYEEEVKSAVVDVPIPDGWKTNRMQNLTFKFSKI